MPTAITADHGDGHTSAVDLLDAEEMVIGADAGHQGIEKRAEIVGRASPTCGLPYAQECVALDPKRQKNGWGDLIEPDKDPIDAKVEQPVHMDKYQFNVQKSGFGACSRIRTR